MAPRIRLGELLVRAGVLDEFKLNAALAEQKRWGGRLGKILVDMSFVSEEILVKALSKQLAVPLARLDSVDVPEDILAKIDPNFCRLNGLCPERLLPDRRTLVLAMADPINVNVTDEIAHKTGLRIEPHLAGERAIQQALLKVWGASSRVLDEDTGEVFTNNRGDRIQRHTSEPPAPVPLPLSAMEPLPASQPGALVTGTPAPAVGEAELEMVNALDAAQKKQLKAIRAMVDLLVEKGVFSRDEYLARVGRR